MRVLMNTRSYGQRKCTAIVAPSLVFGDLEGGLQQRNELRLRFLERKRNRAPGRSLMTAATEPGGNLLHVDPRLRSQRDARARVALLEQRRDQNAVDRAPIVHDPLGVFRRRPGLVEESRGQLRGRDPSAGMKLQRRQTEAEELDGAAAVALVDPERYVAGHRAGADKLLR